MPVQRVTLSQFARICATLEPKLRRAVVRGLQSAAQRHVGLIVEEIHNSSPHPAVDTGALANSVGVRNVRDGAVVEVKAPHAGPIDRGTRPYWPPIQPLVEWVQRKGLGSTHVTTRTSTRRSFDDSGNERVHRTTRVRVAQKATDAEARAIAFAIARIISIRGIEPRHFMRKAWARLPPFVAREVRRELQIAARSRR